MKYLASERPRAGSASGRAPEDVVKSWGRRIGEAAGMGLAWGAAWAATGIVPARVAGFDSDLPFSFLFAPFGIVAGVVFFGILVAIERRGALDRTSPWLFAASGALSGLLLAVYVAALRGNAFGRELLVFGPVLGLAGAACAAVSLAVARRSERASVPSPN